MEIFLINSSVNQLFFFKIVVHNYTINLELILRLVSLHDRSAVTDTSN